MRRRQLQWLWIVLVIVLVWILVRKKAIERFATAATAATATTNKERTDISIPDSTGRIKHRATVEVAKTPADLEHGLMNRTSLPANGGMLFVFPEEAPRSFWMRNTLIPLDMLFFNSNMELIKSFSSVAPHSEEQRESGAPAKYVLEVPGGTVDRTGIVLGDRLVHVVK